MYLVRFLSVVSVNGQEEISASKSVVVNSIKEAKAELDAEMASRDLRNVLNYRPVKSITAGQVKARAQKGVLVGLTQRDEYWAKLSVYYIPN